MKTACLTIILSGLIFTLLGQTSSDSISMKKVFGGYQFYQNDKRLNLTQLAEVMKSNDKAYHEIQSAQSTNTLLTIIGAAGGLMIGWPLGTALAGGDPNWTMAGVGAGLIVVSIPLTKKFNKQTKLAVDTYNAGNRTSSIFERGEIKLAISGSGIGLRMSF